MARLKTFDNDQVAATGEILPSDLNDMQDAYEEAFSTWKVLARAAITISSATTAAYGSGLDAVPAGFMLDDDDFATAIGTDRGALFRIKAVVAINDVAPTRDVAVGLQRVTGVAAASGSAPVVTTTSAAIGPAGTDAAKVTTPAADSITVAAGNAVALATAGLYALQAQYLGGAPAAGSFAVVLATLQMRQV